MRLIYNILFFGFFCISAPYYFWKMWRRGNWQAGFGQRFAQYDAEFLTAVAVRRIVWLHAVSVGEVNICTQLIRALEPRLPGVTLLVSTTTSTGMGELRKKLPQHVLKMSATRCVVGRPDALSDWPPGAPAYWSCRCRRLPR